MEVDKLTKQDLERVLFFVEHMCKTNPTRMNLQTLQDYQMTTTRLRTAIKDRPPVH